MFINRFAKEFDDIKTSTFAPYDYPRNLYEQIINCWHVRERQFQVDVSTRGDTVDDANKEYNQLRKEGFPDHKIEALVKASHKELDPELKSTKTQRKLTDWYHRVPKQQAGQHEEHVEEVQGEGGEGGGEGLSTASLAIKSLYDILKLPRGREMSKELSSNKGLGLVALSFAPLFSTVVKLNKKVDAASKFSRGQSQHSLHRIRLEMKVVELKKIFKELADLVLEDVDVEGMTRMEARAASRRRDTETTLKIEEAIQSMTGCREDLEKFRVKLKIRWDQLMLRGKGKPENPNITVSNAFYSTEECLTKLVKKFDEVGERGEDKVDGMSRDDFSLAIAFFTGMEKEGQEYALPKEFGAALGRKEEKDLAGAIKAVVRWLPVGVLHVGGKDVLIDTTEALSDAVKISKIMAALKKPERTLYVPRKTRKEKVSCRQSKEGKKPRRQRLLTKPYIEEAIKVYAESSGVAAQERRRHEAGTIGFSIPQVTDAFGYMTYTVPNWVPYREPGSPRGPFCGFGSPFWSPFGPLFAQNRQKSS